jgi:uncharacterized membrane protein
VDETDGDPQVGTAEPAGPSEPPETDDDRPVEGRRGERRWGPALVVLVLVAIPVAVPLPNGRSLSLALQILALPLLVAIIFGDPGRIDRRTSALRTLSILMTVVLVAGAAFATGRLVTELVDGAPDLRQASTLLLTGFLIWIDTNLTFALLYWELDGGGAAERLFAPRPFPDFAFPEQLNPSVAPPGWLPTLPDYLYLGLTNALAFSPTDVMPLARWAKLLMAVQSIISVAILSLVIANAVNILG